MFELTQEFYFEAAHTLERQLEREGSRRIHGHTYHAEVTVAGEPDALGMVMDLAALRLQVHAVRALLDHHFLDEVQGLGRPTLENLCRFIAARLTPQLPGLKRVCVARRATGDRCTLDVSS
ncbi:MAG: 6-pyruvoyl trahydropterin synthase family protein [Burkholderiaceae bacterium]